MEKEIFVEKKDGSRQGFDVEKIVGTVNGKGFADDFSEEVGRRVLKWALGTKKILSTDDIASEIDRQINSLSQGPG